MKPLKIRKRPESKIQRAIREALEAEGWHVEKTHGGLYQKGWPDLFAIHPDHGVRFIECKAPKGRLRASQVAKFTTWSEYGLGVWMLDSVDLDALFLPPNWRQWLLKRRRSGTVEDALKAISSQ